MPVRYDQYDWVKGVIAGLTALSDNRWMMPTNHLAVLLEELAKVIRLEVPGAVVEMGCAGGRTNLRLAAFLQLLEEGPGRPLHAYDSFQGFPPLTDDDNPKDLQSKSPSEELDIGINLRYPKGGLPGLFAEWGDGLAPPIIHEGFFSEEGDHPSPIAFAFVDCDAHDSVKTCLRIVWPRLAPGGVLIVHDYGNPGWPGVKKVCDVFVEENLASIVRRDVKHDTMLIVGKRRP